MDYPTQINTDQRNGNLHIDLEGLFTTYTAAKLVLIMEKYYQGKGNIFLHTEKISKVTLFSKAAFKTLLDLGELPQKNIYFTGEYGFVIANDATKVIIRKKKKHGHGGCGKCKNCTCHTRKAA